jgi:hypothetical protein
MFEKLTIPKVDSEAECQSPPTNAEVKKTRIYTTISPYASMT